MPSVPASLPPITVATSDSVFSDDDLLFKHVNAMALMPDQGSRRITFVGRRLYNVLLHRAQGTGQILDEYEGPLAEILQESEFTSNNTAYVKKTLRELMSTTVVWQSATDDEVEAWDSSNLLSGVGLTRHKSGAVTVRWRYDSKVRKELLSPGRYSRFSMFYSMALKTHSSLALYEICSRYIKNPSHLTAKQNWRWWKPVLTGVARGDTKAEYRFFKRDVLVKAIAEVSEQTDIHVVLIEHRDLDGRSIGDIQFEVHLKADMARPSKPLQSIEPSDLPAIGKAIKAGIPQESAETLLKEHGRQALLDGVVDLQKRLSMTGDSIAPVRQPGAWLRDHLERKRRQSKMKVAAVPTRSQPMPSEVAKRRRALTEMWLRERKAEIITAFRELPDSEKTGYIQKFRDQLAASASLAAFLKRLDTSGWDHPMVRDRFAMTLGEQLIGPDWFKPSEDDLLMLAWDMESELLDTQVRAG